MLDYNKYRWMPVFVYLRQSTKTEAWKQVQSIENQRDDCLKVVADWGLKVVEVIEEDESAWKPHERKKFKNMLKQLSYRSIKKRTAEGVVCWHPNRLSRNALEAGMIVQMLDDELIKNIFFSPAYSFHNDTSGKEHLTIEFARAKWYNDSLSEVVIRGIRSREQQGAMVCYRKFWYARKRENKNPKLCSMFPIPHDLEFSVIKEMFDLWLEWKSVQQISKALKLEFPSFDKIPSVTMIDRSLRDSFYCWTWIIRKWTKHERTVNLSKIRLFDWTMFQPAISHENFTLLQAVRSNNRNGVYAPIKRINPLPKLVNCGCCGRLMYPSFRKIKVAWGKEVDRLWYECQGKIDGVRCSQSRIKVDIIESAISKKLTEKSSNMNHTRYQKYLVALNIFTRKKREELKCERSKTTKALTRFEIEKTRLVQQRADLVSAWYYDTHSRDQFEKQLKEVSENIDEFRYRKTISKNEDDQRVTSFCKFLELRENLAQYWDSANLEKKAIFSKTVVLNLSIQWQEVAILRLKKPFFDDEEGLDNSHGAAQGEALEPKFKKIWKWLEISSNHDYMENYFNEIEYCKTQEKLRFPIMNDTAQISWTKQTKNSKNPKS